MGQEKVIPVKVKFDAELGNVLTAAKSMREQLEKIKIPEANTKRMVENFTQLARSVQNYQDISNRPLKTEKDFKAVERAADEVIATYNKLETEFQNIKGIDPKKLIPENTKKRIDTLKTALVNFKKQQEKAQGKANTEKENIKELKTQQQIAQTRKTAAEESAKKYTDLTKELEKQQTILAKMKSDQRVKRNASGTPVNAEQKQKLGSQEAVVKGLQTQLKTPDATKALTELKKAKDAYTDIENKITQATAAQERFENEAKSIKIPEDLLAPLSEAGFNTDLIKDSKQLASILENEVTKGIEDVNTALGGADNNFDEVTASVKKFKSGIDDAADGVDNFTQKENEIAQLRNRMLEFFSIGNAVQLFQQAIRSAFETVKELDAAMTEIAVVSDFTVGDMWDRLPEFTQQANELGVEVEEAYKAVGLFVQQGLDLNASMELSTETLKMARIAGLDAAEATDSMTAALRGFNMTLDETSGKRVNDVYSELAAITASDVGEISTAMSKVASIANSANMEFENTAAFLSQIIETTREAPETAGSALKTVIARFSEVKELQNKGENTGTDEEGEAIDVNKVSSALSSVGISMSDFFAGTEGLDSVLMKLAEKWDTLDVTTQRYIATTAAGSRQQSRFLALMSDYQRTVELTSAAHNSAGAAEEQFGKTLETLENKLAKLKNAWNEFIMGLANNEFIKLGIDILTDILEVINKILEATSGGNGLVKAITSLALAFGILTIGKTVFNKLFTSMGTAFAQGARKVNKDFNKELANDLSNTLDSPDKKNNAEKAGFSLGQALVNGFKKATQGLNDFRTNNIKKGDNIKVSDLGKGINSPLVKQDIARQVGMQTRKNGKAKDNPDALLRFNKALNSGDIDKLDILLKELDVTLVATEDNMDGLGVVIEKTAGKTSQVADGFSSVGECAMIAGAAVIGFASVLSALGASEEVVNYLTTIGGVMTALGGIISTVGIIIELWSKKAIVDFFKASVAAVKSATKTAVAWLASLGWIGAVIVAIAALTAAAVGAYMVIKNNSIEKQLEKAKEEAEALKEVANKAKESLNELLDKKSEYNSTQETLYNLTKGTAEFQEALMKANMQVLELLTNYPKLANYLSTGEYGQITIDTEGWNAIIEEQEKAVKNAVAAQALSQIRVNQLSQSKLKEERKKSTKLSEKEIKKIQNSIDANFLKIDENGEYSKSLVRLADSLNVTEKELYNLALKIQEVDQSLSSLDVQINKQAEAALTAMVDEDVLGSKYGKQLTQIGGQNFVTNYQSSIDALSKTMQQDFTSTTEKGIRHALSLFTIGITPFLGQMGVAGNALNLYESRDKLSENEDFNRLATEYEVVAEVEGLHDTDALKILYAKMMGLKSVEDIPEAIAKNNDKMFEAISQVDIMQDLSESINKLTEKIEHLAITDETAAKIATAVATGDYSNLTKTEIALFTNDNTGANYLSNLYQRLGYESKYEYAKASGFGGAASELTEEERKRYGIRKIDKDWYNYALDNTLGKLFNFETGETVADYNKKLDKELTEAQFDYRQKQAQESANIQRNRALGDITGTNFSGGVKSDEGFFGIKNRIYDSELPTFADGNTTLSSRRMLTDDEISILNLNEKQKETFLNSGQLIIDEIEIALTDFQRHLLLSTDKGLRTQSLTQGNKNAIDTSGLEDLTVNQLSGIAIQTENMGALAAQKYIDTFAGVINNSGLSNKEKTQLQDYLVSIDWTSASQALDALEKMQSFNLDTGKIKDFWNSAADGANLYVSSLEEAYTLTNRFVKGIRQAFDIKEGLKGGTLTPEQVEELVMKGIDISKLRLEANGNYSADKETAEQIGQALKEKTVEQAEIIYNKTKEQFNKVVDSTTLINDYVTFSGDGKAAVNEDGLESADDQTVKLLGDELGVIKTEEETPEMFKTRVLEEYKTLIANYNNSDAILNNLEQGVELAQAATYTDTEALQKYRDEPGEVSKEAAVRAMETQALDEGFETADLKEFAAAIQETNTGLDDAEAHYLALQNMKMNKGLGEVMSSYEDWNALIDKNSGLIKTSGAEDVKTYNNLKKSVNTMLNTSKDLSKEFWNSSKNMENLKKAAEGDTEALEALQKAAAIDQLKNMEFDAEQTDLENAKMAVDSFSSYLEGIDLPEMQPGVDLSDVYDGSEEFIDKFNTMANTANMTAEQIQEAAKSMGFDAEITYEDSTRSLPIYEQTEEKIDNGDGTTTIRSQPPVITDYKNVLGKFPVVKTLTSTGSGGGGVSTKNVSTGNSNKEKSTGGSSNKSKKWKNPYDKLTNASEKLNATLREREKLERDYDRLLKNRKATGEQLLQNSFKQIANLNEEIARQQQIANIAKTKIKNLGSETYEDEDGNEKTFEQWGVTKYFDYDEDTNTITVDYEGLNALKDDPEAGAAAEEFHGLLTDLRDQAVDANESIEDAVDVIREIENRGKEEYLDLESRIHEALVNEQNEKFDDRQEEIDDLSEAYDKINEYNSKILEAMQESINLERQIRDNTDTEKDIAEKQERLNYLRLDTSGANAAEILSLEKELEDDQQAYQDTLIDQQLEKLNETNTKAEEQRAEQIELMQEALDKEREAFEEAVEQGVLWGRVEELLKGGMTKNNEELTTLLQESDGFKGMSKFAQNQWMFDLAQAFASGTEGRINYELDKYRESDESIKTNQGNLAYDNDSGMWVDKKGNKYAITGGSEAKGYTAELQEAVSSSEGNGTTKKSNKYGIIISDGTDIIGSSSSKQTIKALQYALNQKGKYGLAEDGIFGSQTRNAVKDFQQKNGLDDDGIPGKNTRAKLTPYKTGGLVTETGPAWLDGTGDKPEMVLNAVDTANFIELKDILSESLHGRTFNQQKPSGDTYVEVNINVEEIGSDYDVEQMVERVKQDFVNAADYRNANFVDLMI